MSQFNSMEAVVLEGGDEGQSMGPFQAGGVPPTAGRTLLCV